MTGDTPTITCNDIYIPFYCYSYVSTYHCLYVHVSHGMMSSYFLPLIQPPSVSCLALDCLYRKEVSPLRFDRHANDTPFSLSFTLISEEQ